MNTRDKYKQKTQMDFKKDIQSKEIESFGGFNLRIFLKPLIGIAVLISIFWTLFFYVQSRNFKLIPIESSVKTSPDQQTHLMLDNNVHSGKYETVVSCYYNTPSNQTTPQLMPMDIHPHLCTHINIAFAQIRDKKIYLDVDQYKSLSDIVLLKKTNPKLKILLSIGGANNDKGFPDMVADHASRKTFIRSVKSILRNYSLDGIDLDWEFPEIRGLGGVQRRERQHFSQLLREIRMEYIREKKDYLLTVAIAAVQTIVDTAYDVDQINLYVDYANIMTYDFHFFTKYTPFTGLNSPLYQRSTEQMYMATLNINYTVQMYLSKGLDRSKIVVGIPTYGHSFTLVNEDNAGVGSPASGFGMLGGLGFVNYPEICEFIEEFKTEVSIREDSDAKVPYLYKDKEWVSYDTPKSAMEKARYVKEQKLRGAMIYSLNADDFLGVCNQKPKGNLKFPLAVSIKNALVADSLKSMNN